MVLLRAPINTNTILLPVSLLKGEEKCGVVANVHSCRTPN